MSDSGLYVNRQTGKQNNLNSPTSRQDDNARSASQFLERIGKSTQQPVIYQSPTTVKRSPIYAGPDVGGILDRYA